MKLLIYLTMALSKLLLANSVITELRCKNSALEKHFPQKRLPTLAWEFDNGNTFVQTNPSGSGYPFAGKRGRVLIPRMLSSDTLSELLLKVYAMRKGLAQSIDIVSDREVNELVMPYELPLLHLLATAGADRFCVLEKCQGIKPEAKVHGVFMPRYHFVSLNHPELAEKVSAELGRRTNSPEKVPSNTSVIVLASPTAPTNDSLWMTLSSIRKMKERGVPYIHLVSPYLPYARSDKQEMKHGISAQGRLIAKLIESMGVDAITVVRPHAPQSLGFFDIPSFVIEGHKTINAALKRLGIEVVISPDAGFQKEASKYAAGLGLPVGVLNKARSIGGDAELKGGTGLEHVPQHTVAVIDDETATGGTLMMAAARLKKLGAKKVVAIVTHLAGDGAKAVQSQAIDLMVVADTLPISRKIKDHKGIQVISVAGEIARHIRKLYRER